MGIAASVSDQHRLFEDLKSQHEAHAASTLNRDEHNSDDSADDNTGGNEVEERAEGENADVMQPYVRATDDLLYQQANSAYSAWYRGVRLKQDVTFCELTDFEDAIADAFKLGKTPLILDTSTDDKVCTFFSYQPDVAILDAKSMVMAGATGPAKQTKATKTAPRGPGMSLEARLGAMDVARKTLVNAMKFGKLLVIRLGTSAPDFVHAFSDESLDMDTSTHSSAYFPLLVFEKGGALFHDVRVDFGENRKGSSKVNNGVESRKLMRSSSQNEGSLTKSDTEDIHALAEITEKKAPSWAERLFREEDMRPHKNFALCR